MLLTAASTVLHTIGRIVTDPRKETTVDAIPVEQTALRVAKPMKRHAPSSTVSVPPNDDNSDTDKCSVCYENNWRKICH